MLTKADAVKRFKLSVVPVVNALSPGNEQARMAAWHNYLDVLAEAGEISPLQQHNWSYPSAQLELFHADS